MVMYHLYKIDVPFRLHIKFGFDWPGGFENNGHVHVYSPGAGADNPLGSIFFKNINLLLIKPFAASFPHLINL